MSEIIKKDERELHQYRPATDIVEREDGFYIYMDMPGVKRENMVIDLNESELVVTGRTSLEEGEGELFSERQFQNCEYIRSVSITDIVDREHIKANLDNGVLELHLPKVEKVQPKKIAITTA